MFPTPTTRDVDYNQVYEPAEDSFLFLDLLQQESEFISDHINKCKSLPLVVELGTGSGIITTFFHKYLIPSKSQGLFLGVDLNVHACMACLNTFKQNGGVVSHVDSVQMDLTTSLRGHSVDFLLFNPPYVPDEIVPSVPESDDDPSWLDLALLGGTDGMQVTNRVLDSLDHILAENGVAYILFCKRNHPENVAEMMRARNWLVYRVGERRCGWEVLSIWRFQRKENEKIKG